MDSSVYYKILPVEGIFLGLNARAVEYLLLFGEWITTKSLHIAMPEGHEFGMLFIGEKEDGEDFVIAGSVWGENVLPTLTYDYLKVGSGKDKRNIPLYKYKMANYDVPVEGVETDTVWTFEVKDKRNSILYKNMNLLCLTTDFIIHNYAWEPKEIELSEVLMEYEEGRY